MDRFIEILKTYWGYDSFRSLQPEIIRSVSEGNDTLGLMPTGGGKSITFQVPALLKEGICIVITPLIALMKDQVDNLKQKGIKATAVHSGMSRQEIIVALENCVFGNYKFLYLAPERIKSDLFLAKLHYMHVSMLVVDESHCISQWGYDFRPSYLHIAEIRQRIPDVPILALTATATKEVIEDIQDKLLFRKKNVFRKSFERKNIAYIVKKTEDKLFEIKNILSKTNGSGIIYVRSRKKTREIAEALQHLGIQADYYHAGINPDEKIIKQNKWKSGELRIMACTNAFGMGIDKPDVRTVIHYEMPGSLEEYFQEAGRAGRDEKKAYAVALYSKKDEGRLKKRVKEEFPEKELIKDIYEKMAYYFQIAINSGFQTTHTFNLQEFGSIFKFSFTAIHYALKILQLAGYIEYLEEIERRSRIIFTVTRDELYKYTNQDKDSELLLRTILRSYTGVFSEYVYIDEQLLSTRTGINNGNIYELLKSFSRQHIISYIPKQKDPTITYLQNRVDIKYLVIPKYVYEDRKKRLEDRIKNVVSYGNAEHICRSKLLLEYFDEKNTNSCGHCDICLQKKRTEPDRNEFNEIFSAVSKLLHNSSCSVNEIISQLPQYSSEKIIKVLRYSADNGNLSIDSDRILPHT